jgi:hypothetical protein
MRRAVAACTPVSSSPVRPTRAYSLQPEVYFRLGPGKELDPEVEKLKREMNQHRI